MTDLLRLLNRSVQWLIEFDFLILMGFILFSVSLISNHSEKIPLKTERIYHGYEKTLMNTKLRK